MSRNRNRRYYDDSDDMIERVRRAREAFEKKANAFQGPDWPGYDKRIIVGKKKKEDVPAAQPQADAVAAPASAETTQPSSQPNNFPDQASATTVDQTSSWWATQREAQKASPTADASDQSTNSTHHSDDKVVL